MRLYVEVAKRAFARQMAYRTANLAGLTTNAFFGTLISFMYIGLYGGREIEAGWTLRDTLDFVWISQSLLTPVYIWGWWEIALTIRSGDVVSDLSKPLDYYSFWLSQDAGRAVFHVLFRLAPTLLMGSLLFGLGLPADAGRWGAFLLSLALAVWISFGLRFLVNVSAFWLLDYRGPGMLLLFANSFLSGLLVPLVFWPDWARGVVGWLPFAGIIQAPVDVILGKATGPGLAGVLLFQLAWGLALLAAGRLLLALAVRRVVIQGG